MKKITEAVLGVSKVFDGWMHEDLCWKIGTNPFMGQLIRSQECYVANGLAN